jgi:twinkle protein
MEASIIKVEDIVSFEEIPYETTYDITVENNHNFYLATNDLPILVHNSGKSEFTDYMMTELSRKYKFLWAISSFENQPVSLHATKIMQKYVGKAFDFRKDAENRMTRSEFDDAFNFTANNFIFIDIETADITIDGLLEKFTELVVRRGINGVLIDPWNRIESKKQRGQNEGEYINDCLTKIKNFAKKNNVHVFLIAHPTKMPKVNGRFEVPNMYSISGSANFYNQTDNGITVYRDLDDSVSVFIQKIRFDWLGKIGECRFLFDKYKRRYIPDGEPEPTMTHIPDNPRAAITKKSSDIPF